MIHTDAVSLFDLILLPGCKEQDYTQRSFETSEEQ